MTTREKIVRNLLTELIDMIDNGSRRDLDRVDEISKSILEIIEQESVLDKISAEIEQLHLIGYATIDGKREIASRAVMQIIDKYKAESEGK